MVVCPLVGAVGPSVGVICPLVGVVYFAVGAVWQLEWFVHQLGWFAHGLVPLVHELDWLVHQLWCFIHWLECFVLQLSWFVLWLLWLGCFFSCSPSSSVCQGLWAHHHADALLGSGSILKRPRVVVVMPGVDVLKSTAECSPWWRLTGVGGKSASRGCCHWVLWHGLPLPSFEIRA